MRDTSSTRTPATRPPPSRTSATTPSTRSACVLATTEANTKASHGAAHGPTATITVAGEPAETPTPEPVQQPEEDPVQQQSKDDPDPPAGTIETITAADDTGQLLLTWTAPAAPNADPTDYHVNWAKSTEDYPADTASRRERPSNYDHAYVGGPRVRH